MRMKLLVCAAFLLTTANANAAVIFSEDFDDEAAGGSVLNFTAFDQFSVTQGFVDIIQSGGFFINCVGMTGGCVDLDGSTSSNPTSALTSDPISFQPGVTYTLSFDISGDQRQRAQSNTTLASITNGVLAPQTISMLSTDPFQTFSFSFSVASVTLASILFATPGQSDAFGLILDNVLLTSGAAPPVPLPAAAPLMLLGLSGLGLAMRRRQ